MERRPSEIPMVSRVLLVKFTNIREGLTEMEIFHHICIKGRSGGGGGLEVIQNMAEYAYIWQSAVRAA